MGKNKKRIQMQRKKKYLLSRAQRLEISECAAEEFRHGRPMRPVPRWALMSEHAYEAFAFALSDEIEKLKNVG